MSSRSRVLLSWSSGKDSAWALHVLRRDPSCELVGLVTTLNESNDRVAMHAVRRRLVEAQARAIGLPLRIVPLPDPCSNEEYERRMRALVDAAALEGVTEVAFGDLFLEDIRAYRERQMRGTGLGTRFPIWQRDTRGLAREMLAAGVRATLTCVDPARCPREFVGREWDETLLAELPDSVDPCGENGEFHTFVHASPDFSAAIPIELGEVVERGGFVYRDLKSPRSIDRSAARDR